MPNGIIGSSEELEGFIVPVFSWGACNNYLKLYAPYHGILSPTREKKEIAKRLVQPAVRRANANSAQPLFLSLNS